MKIFCTKDDLADGVSKVQKAVSARNTLPVLQGIKMSTEGDALIFEATDLEMGIRCRVPVNVLEEGVMVLPASLLADLTRRLPEGAVSLESADNILNIIYGESNFQINGFDPEEFPELGRTDMEENFALDGARLKKMIKQTIFARALLDEAKPVFSGVLLEKNSENVRLVCTDTHRLAFISLPLAGEGSDFSGVIPGKTMAEILRLLEDETVSVSFDRSKMIFKFQNVEIMTRLIAGQYPNYVNVIPKSCGTKVRFHAKQMEDVVERASLISRDNPRKIAVVRLRIADNQISIAQNNESGRIFEIIEVEQEGDDVQISFNARYMLDMLRVMETEYLIMEASGPFGAAIFRPDNEEEYISMILPMRQ
ncbi:MAG: DNA polymerase III subunit beta [Gracilibacteraceae bacterium]|jgi:DNA polymerase-3 subunit beta|nr:DNA polymerase III subunit beta [Gracilibacteraceae bacterium]